MNILCVWGVGGMMNMWIFLGYYHKTDLFLGVISIPFWGFFLRTRYKIGIFFEVAKFQILFGVCLIFLTFLLCCL